MARFDVFRNPDGPGALLDVQANLLSDLNTCVVVPLLPKEQAPLPARYLNPEFSIEGQDLVLVTQYVATVPRLILSQRVDNITRHADEVTRAMDMLLQGF